MTSMYGVKRRDTTKGPPLRILSLDGGGVRGYSMLIILQELMHRTFVEMEGRAPRRDQIPKPCDHFDLIVGTGTGGLIALMLGRLRLDVETCKELYVRLTRVVFQTDKTIAGIPYRSTLFKASKLEEVIREAVAEHTVFVGEGNDGTEIDPSPSLAASLSKGSSPKRYPSNASVLSFSARSPHSQMARPAFTNRMGNPEARLYDARENRTKTAITATYKGTPKGGKAVFLRSYDSRKEPPPEFDCKIWEAGRATCAITLAFKPIQIGQSIFLDDGGGTFNPSPQALDEAVVNEWPGRDVGVFVSVGTGRRPKMSDADQHVWYEGFMGDFADARRKLIAKIEGCESIHEYMEAEHLLKRNVNIEHYYRLNVEMGVGEFGMNEWNRLGEISTNTRRYLMREDEQRKVEGITTKLAKVHRAKLRYEGTSPNLDPGDSFAVKEPDMTSTLAVELPAEIPTSWPAPRDSPPSRTSYDSGPDRLPIRGRTPSPGSSSHRDSRTSVNLAPQSPQLHPQQLHPQQQQHRHYTHPPPGIPPPISESLDRPGRSSSSSLGGRQQYLDDILIVTAPTPDQLRTASGTDKIAITDPDEQPRRSALLPPPLAKQQHKQQQQQQQQHQHQQPSRIEPPPVPPKTPLPDSNRHAHQASRKTTMDSPLPPYPVDEYEPPPVARKPEYRRR